MTPRTRLITRFLSSTRHGPLKPPTHHRSQPPPPPPSPSLFSAFRTTSILAFYILNIFFTSHIITEYVGYWSLCTGPSMLPTISVAGDRVLLSKYNRRGRGVQVGDLVAFKHPLVPEAEALKRVAGMPGDFVCAGEKVEGRGREGMIQVPEGHCWVLGDNLPESRDSRVYGPLPMALIRGKGVARIWPLTEICWLRNTLQPPEADV